MEDQNLDLLYEYYYSKLNEANSDFVRYLYRKINWDARLIGIKGPRGVGKTTLLMQRIKHNHADDYESAFYASLDNLWFNDNSLIDLVRYLNDRGVRYLYLDEVHKYPKWTQTLKNIYDMFPRLNIVYTGSSLLEIDNSVVDLSRRQTLYSLRCMSFREYLEYEQITTLDPLSLEDILSSHIKIAMEITAKIDVLKYFSQYLEHGCYPFFKDSGKDFHLHLQETARLVIDSDIPAVEHIEYQTLEKMKKLLMIMSRQIPFLPNMSTLSEQISTNRNLGIKMLYLLDRAAILNLITCQLKSYKNLKKPEKVLFDNPNLMYAFCSKPETGTVRETFFANQLGYAGSVTTAPKGDFLIDEKHIFEVGGRTKTFDQIKDLPDSYLAVDDTAIGRGCRIPLWLFGMMY